MITDYRLFFEKVPFPLEGQTFLLCTGERLIRHAGNGLQTLLDAFYDSDCDAGLLERQAALWAEELEIHPYTATLILLICAAKRLRQEYRHRGYPEPVFWDTMTDLRSKAQECRDVKGIWGTFVGFWFPNIFRCRTFRLGRLEFEVDTWRLETDATIQGRKITPQDPVYNVHIPSGEPLHMDSCMESFHRAYSFFGEKPMLCRCGSWLLNPQLIQTFPQDGNIPRFLSLWKVYQIRPDLENKDLWRIFGGADFQDYRLLPTWTSVQRAVRDWLVKGNTLDIGRGVLIYDGAQIINQ